jgi:hypothetical protein
MTIAASHFYSPGRYRRARVTALVLALLGVMTFAAVASTAVQCRNEPQRLLRNAGGGCIQLNSASCLLINERHPRCEVVAGHLHWVVSERALDILRKIGVPFFYI